MNNRLDHHLRLAAFFWILPLLCAGSAWGLQDAGHDADKSVASAIAMIDGVAIDTQDRSKWPPAVVGMKLLADHFFRDPRSERKLSDMARRAENFPRIGLQTTLPSLAWDHLIRLRANKLDASWMAGLDTVEQRLTKIRKILAEHEDLLKRPARDDAAFVTQQAIEIAARRSLKQGGAQAVDIAMLYPIAIDAAYAKTHSKKLIQKLGALEYGQAITRGTLIEKLATTNNASFASLVIKWFSQADDDTRLLWFTDLIDGLPDARPHFLGLLEHDRPQVVAYAALRLGLKFPDAESLAAMDKQQQRIQQLDVDEKYKNLFASAIRRTQIHLKTEAGRDKLLTEIASPINKTHLFADVTELIRSYPDRVALDRLTAISQQFQQAGSKRYAQIIDQRIELLLEPKPHQAKP